MLKACEQIPMQEKQWRDLPSMQEARCDFNPCEYQSLLYLCGYGSCLLETFDPVTSVFATLSVHTPEEYRSCCVFEEQGQLVVISDQYVTHWRRGSQGLLQVASTPHSEYEMFCNMAPLVDSVSGRICISFYRCIYSVEFDGSERKAIAT